MHELSAGWCLQSVLCPIRVLWQAKPTGWSPTNLDPLTFIGDSILTSTSFPITTHFSALCHPSTRAVAVEHALRSAHAYRVLIAAGNPMLWPIRVLSRHVDRRLRQRHRDC